MKSIIVFVFCSLLSGLAFAEGDHKMPTPKPSPEFEKLKALVGTWEGSIDMHGKKETGKVT